MGNTESSVSSGVKGQANAASGIYALVDLNGKFCFSSRRNLYRDRRAGGF